MSQPTDRQREAEEEAEHFALKMGAMIQMRKDGLPVTLENLRAIAEVNAKQAYLAGRSKTDAEIGALRAELEQERKRRHDSNNDRAHVFAMYSALHERVEKIRDAARRVCIAENEGPNGEALRSLWDTLSEDMKHDDASSEEK